LLTDRIKNTKHRGEKHERDYNFDLLEILGIDSKDRSLYLPIGPDDEGFIDGMLTQHGIGARDKIVTIHPGASCPSKIWPSERFAKLADRLMQAYKVKVIVIGGDDKRDEFCVNSVKKFMQQKAVFLAGSLNVLQLGALLKRSKLFISNDSGPVHVAVSVNTPVVAIFGRNQPGLSPKRWGPLGQNDIVIHKDVGCAGICLAHNCNRSFDCLSAISVDEVFSAIKGKGLL
jgi:ADP-heptose:LPS heptosyltransferase